MEGVRPGRVDLDLADREREVGDLEADARAFAAPNPLGLHRPHPLGPAVKMVQRRQQLGSAVGDPQEPLRQLPFLDRCAGTPATAVHHLLVRQHRRVHRVPVDPALAPIHQPSLQERQEQPLLLPVVAHVAGGELARPIDREPHSLQLGPHGGDVPARPLGRVDAALAGGVLRRQPESVPPHRVHHRVAARPLVAGHHVAQRVVADMAHVDVPTWVGEHLKNIVLRLAICRHVGDAEQPCLVPGILPTAFDRREIVAMRAWRLVRACQAGRVVHHVPPIARFGGS